ncbi:methyltransferase domain-containing protein [Jiella sp. MQZ9-1]|uniref:class I SAM-dependent methyltransferase n=1 Tax=Jiella flava TaxID=2816857 RepID=UPI001E59FB79|nr:methyltransferase domain-containing protein [Jiella flava]
MVEVLQRRQQSSARPRIKVSDEARFFRGWLQRPLITGAVSPSSRALGRAMASYVPDPALFSENSRVLELGPGTGVVTQMLLQRGVPERSLVLIEYSHDFCKLLRQRFPDAEVIEGDAYAIGRALPEWIGADPLEAVVSSLPLFTRPDEMREEVVGRSLEMMRPGAPFIQFSYALTQPVKAKKIGATLELSPWVKRNLPPARVLVYRSADKASAPPISSADRVKRESKTS